MSDQAVQSLLNSANQQLAGDDQFLAQNDPLGPAAEGMQKEAADATASASLPASGPAGGLQAEEAQTDSTGAETSSGAPPPAADDPNAQPLPAPPHPKVGGTKQSGVQNAQGSGGTVADTTAPDSGQGS